MKSAVFLYNTQSGKCKIERCTEAVCTVFRAYGYDIKPQLIDFCEIIKSFLIFYSKSYCL